MKEDRFHKTIFFLLSPVLSLPMTLYGICRKSNYSLFLFVLTIGGLLSYLFIPYADEDRARYYSLYLELEKMSWSEVFQFLATLPDFSIYLYYALMAKMGFYFQFATAILNALSVGVIFFVFRKLTENQYKNYFLYFIFICLAISYVNLFAGIRFYLSATFILLAFYYRFFERKKLNGFIFLILAVSVHYSSALFIAVYCTTILLENRPRWAKLLFIISFSFLLIPRSEILTQFEVFGIGETMDDKLEFYLGSEDHIESGWEINSNAKIVFLLRSFWLVLAYCYLLFTIKRTSRFRTILYCTVFFISIFYQAPTVFDRYLNLFKLLFALHIIVDSIKTGKLKVLYLFLCCFFIDFAIQIYTMRYELSASYFNLDTLFLPLGLFKEITEFDFLPEFIN